jgi:hypothetical protein
MEEGVRSLCDCRRKRRRMRRRGMDGLIGETIAAIEARRVAG